MIECSTVIAAALVVTNTSAADHQLVLDTRAPGLAAAANPVSCCGGEAARDRDRRGASPPRLGAPFEVLNKKNGRP